VILVHAPRNFTVPDESSTELVEVTSLSEYNIARLQRKSRELALADGNLLHFRKIQMPILDVGYAKIRHLDSLARFHWSTFGDPRLHCTTLPKRYDLPRHRHWSESGVLLSPASDTLSEELLHEGILEFSQQRNQFFLLLDRALYSR
jgi:hypothetical protein